VRTVIVQVKYSANDMVFKEHLENNAYPEDNIKPSLTTEGAIMTSASRTDSLRKSKLSIFLVNFRYYIGIIFSSGPLDVNPRGDILDKMRA